MSSNTDRIREAAKSITQWGSRYGTYAPLEQALAEIADDNERLQSENRLMAAHQGIDNYDRLLSDVEELRQWQKTNRSAIARASNAEADNKRLQSEIERLQQRLGEAEHRIATDLIDSQSCLSGVGKRMDELGITEQDIAETNFPRPGEAWPKRREGGSDSDD